MNPLYKIKTTPSRLTEWFPISRRFHGIAISSNRATAPPIVTIRTSKQQPNNNDDDDDDNNNNNNNSTRNITLQRQEMDALTSTIRAAKRVILSVGSGDGSQQSAIVQSGHHNIISTFFDSEQVVTTKYPKSQEHIALLRQQSTAVLFAVDATKLHVHPELKGHKFDIIVFTFPHTGSSNFTAGCSGPNPKSIEENKQLIRDFLLSAQTILAHEGEIHITLKTSAPYTRWTFPDFAKYAIESKLDYNFPAAVFPGYTHRSTKGHIDIVKNGAAKTFVFGQKKKYDTDDNEEEGEKGGDKEKKIEDNDVFYHSSPFTLAIQFQVVEDVDLESFVTEVLSSFSSKAATKTLNALDIRRRFPEAIHPDTRQLNRVLYQMETSKKVKRGPPSKKATNKKPTWILISDHIIRSNCKEKGKYDDNFK